MWYIAIEQLALLSYNNCCHNCCCKYNNYDNKYSSKLLKTVASILLCNFASCWYHKGFAMWEDALASKKSSCSSQWQFRLGGEGAQHSHFCCTAQPSGQLKLGNQKELPLWGKWNWGVITSDTPAELNLKSTRWKWRILNFYVMLCLFTNHIRPNTKTLWPHIKLLTTVFMIRWLYQSMY